jgi:hypothetical protein
MKKIIQELRQILNNYEKELSRLKHQYVIDTGNKEQVIQSLTSLLNDRCEGNRTDFQPDLMN